jgi:hypothetical protein
MLWGKIDIFTTSTTTSETHYLCTTESFDFLQQIDNPLKRVNPEQLFEEKEKEEDSKHNVTFRDTINKHSNNGLICLINVNLPSQKSIPCIGHLYDFYCSWKNPLFV